MSSNVHSILNNNIEAILKLNMTFDWKLVVFAYKNFHIQLVFEKCLEVVWRFEQRCSILKYSDRVLFLCIEGQTLFGTPRGAKMSLVLNDQK